MIQKEMTTAPELSATECTEATGSDLPFDLTEFLSQRLGVSVEKARQLLGTWLREQDCLRHLRGRAPAGGVAVAAEVAA